MPRAATETFAARCRGLNTPMPKSDRNQRNATALATAIVFGAAALTWPVWAQGPEPEPESQPAAESESEDPLPSPQTPTIEKNSVPFPRTVQLGILELGPPPPPVLAQMGTAPDWSELDYYQHSILREEFENLLRDVYAANDQAWPEFIEILDDRVRIKRQSNWPSANWYELFFRLPTSTEPANVARYWTPPWQLRPLVDATKPLADLHILVDPGHIGGEFARTEGRWYQIGSQNDPIMEGEMSLRVARILQHDLTLLGARVSLSRDKNAPVTPLRPTDLIDDSRDWYLRKSKTTKPLLPRSQIETMAHKFFYLNSEIRSRADIINDSLRPDLALCLHFNAEAWGNPRRPRFKRSNHYHILVNGCYSRSEMAEDDHRLDMMLRLLQRVHYYELGMAEEIADSMGRETRLPPMAYNTPNARKVGDQSGVWARDLLANRKFLCPVVFFEPYIMNNREVHDRVQEGEYRGLRKFNGVFKKNLYQEYADAITSGLVNYFRRERR